MENQKEEELVSDNSSTELPEEESLSENPKSQIAGVGFSQPAPVKRPVGRPRKYPIPVNYAPPPPKVKGLGLYQELDNQGITAKDIQKYLLKKKVKKYVQKYVTKYKATPPRVHFQEPTYDDDDPETFEEIEESSEEEEPQTIKPQIGGVGSIQGGETSKTKLDQIMGHRSKPRSQARSSFYRY